MGKRGTNQLKSLSAAVPGDALGFWADRLRGHGVEVRETESFATQRLPFAHPAESFARAHVDSVSAGSTITSAVESQEAVKDWIVGLGFADVSDVKDHGYFFSMYARTRGGALFELPYSTPQGFFIDEAENARGTHKGIPPRWERGRAEIAQLEPIGTVDPVAGATAAPTRRGGD